MKPALTNQRAEALLRLERTRMQWVLHSAGHAQPTGGASERGADELAAGSPLNAVLTEWLATELAARLWPEPPSDADGAPGGDDCQAASSPRPPLPSQVLSQTLAEWTGKHPWLSVLAGLLAGSLAVSQRQRLLRWGISAALPWLASNAAVLAMPVLAQWLMRQPAHAEAHPPAEPEAPFGPPADAMPPPGEAEPLGDLSASRSPAARSPA